jgi:hypothetical protein
MHWIRTQLEAISQEGMTRTKGGWNLMAKGKNGLPSAHCAHLTLSHTATSEWTVDRPMEFACRRCTNNGRACIVYKDGEYFLLPLVEELRGNASPTMVEYFMQAECKRATMRYQGLWETKRRIKSQSTEDEWEAWKLKQSYGGEGGGRGKKKFKKESVVAEDADGGAAIPTP